MPHMHSQDACTLHSCACMHTVLPRNSGACLLMAALSLSTCDGDSAFRATTKPFRSNMNRARSKSTALAPHSPLSTRSRVAIPLTADVDVNNNRLNGECVAPKDSLGTSVNRAARGVCMGVDSQGYARRELISTD